MPGNPARRLIAADQIVLLHSDDWRERIPYDDNPQPIIQCRSGDIRGAGLRDLRKQQRGCNKDDYDC